jgi:hypothetical protein
MAPARRAPEVVSALRWHEGFKHAADAALDALVAQYSMLRVFRGSADPSLVARSCGLRLRGAPCN